MTTMTEPPVEQPAEADGKPSRLQAMMQFELTKAKVKRKDLMHFSRQMAVFIRAGIPILDALDAITEEMGSKRLKEVLDEIKSDLRAGSTFADAVDHHPDVFPAYYRGILRSAELTGHLDTVLMQLSDYIERDLEARQKVTSALVYPAVVLVMSIVVVAVLTVWVLPRFEKFFKSLHAKLPLATRILLDVAHFVHVWVWVIVGVLVAIPVLVALALRTERGQIIKDKLFLKLPVFGDVVQHVILERFCRMLSSMVHSGVPLDNALRVTTEGVSNHVYEVGLDAARQEMLRGEGLAAPLARTGLFPASARQMFLVGERSGTMDEQLETAADYFARELDYKIKRLTSLFEPAVLLFMGLIVGFVAIALVSAMYGIFRSSSI